MYRKILLAYDGSTHGIAALRQAADLALVCKAELHVLDIVVTPGGLLIAQPESSIDLWGMERRYVRETVEIAAHDLAGQGVNVVAHEIQADLAVLGHSDKGVIARWFQGSTGADLFTDMPCSLLIAID
jgi:nucleotide-binding universal stress UspA family protein